MEKYGIGINAVAPGPIWTPLQEADGDKKKLEKLGESTPYKRPGQPVELAPVYVLLASQEGSYITGEIYGVTGGHGHRIKVVIRDPCASGSGNHESVFVRQQY